MSELTVWIVEIESVWECRGPVSERSYFVEDVV